MKKRKVVILARHGESTANESGVHQGIHAALTVRGGLQAAKLGAEFERRKVTALVSSGEPRAIQTIRPASGRLGITPTVDELFNERRRPGVTVGLRGDDPVDRYVMGLVEAGAQYSNEEGINDLLIRGYNIFRFFEEHPSDCIGIALHAHILRALHVILCTRFNATVRDYQLAYDTLRIDNAGICVFEYAQGHKTNEWRWHLVTWNETAHLR